MFLQQRIHFIGIGGIGMSAIAKILFQKGFIISGSDKSENNIVRDLRKKGIKVFNSHINSNLGNSDVVVYSSAINKNNPELKEARKKKIPIFSRAMMLAEVMRLKASITIAGSHGKTTTTSLIYSIFEDSGLDPTIINGGIINSIGANAKLGRGEFIIAEADESDGSFTLLPSTIGIINNIDKEHLDFYNNLDEIKRAFTEYANKIPFYGFLVVCNDDKNIKSIIKSIKSKRLITFGFSEKSNFKATNVKIRKNLTTVFDIKVQFKKKKVIKNVEIPLFGSHNVLNALCAFSLCYQLNIPIKEILKSLRNFRGVKRRFTILYKNNKNLIIDDYAHHPKEIKTTLETLRQIDKNKIVVVFEPHRFSRLNALLNDFLQSFLKADFIFILPIYSAGEKNVYNLNNEKLSNLLKKKYKTINVNIVGKEKTFFSNLKKHHMNNHNIIFLGAGNSSFMARKFVEYLKSND